MANVTINNNTTQPNQTNNSSLQNSLGRIVTILFWFIGIVLLIGAIIIAYNVIDNWDYIYSFFTTGLIGWLNPFDDPDGDKSPLRTVAEKAGLTKGQDAVQYMIGGALDAAQDAVNNE